MADSSVGDGERSAAQNAGDPRRIPVHDLRRMSRRRAFRASAVTAAERER